MILWKKAERVFLVATLDVRPNGREGGMVKC